MNNNKKSYCWLPQQSCFFVPDGRWRFKDHTSREYANLVQSLYDQVSGIYSCWKPSFHKLFNKINRKYTGKVRPGNDNFWHSAVCVFSVSVFFGLLTLVGLHFSEPLFSYCLFCIYVNQHCIDTIGSICCFENVELIWILRRSAELKQKVNWRMVWYLVVIWSFVIVLDWYNIYVDTKAVNIIQGIDWIKQSI